MNLELKSFGEIQSTCAVLTFFRFSFDMLFFSVCSTNLEQVSNANSLIVAVVSWMPYMLCAVCFCGVFEFFCVCDETGFRMRWNRS